jgi:hypothetical protein
MIFSQKYIILKYSNDSKYWNEAWIHTGKYLIENSKKINKFMRR